MTITADLVGTGSRQPSALRQWAALTERQVRTMVLRGDLVISLIAPLIFTVGFYLPLKFVMKLQGIDYAQFVMAIIVLQTMAFTMNASAALAALEAVTGFTDRLRTMPLPKLVPLASRVSSGLFRSVVTLTAAIAYGYVIGFRLSGGIGQTVLFCGFALGVGTVLSIGADALGMLSKSPQAVSQALTLPTLIFGMLSCGFVPETGFPSWIRPFVRNQPVSQFSYALRDLTDDGVSWHVIWPGLAWLGGLALVLTPLAIWASARRE
ncbi:ABC transporter permease [Antrihabitans cavernicola]|uniref:Antibiotic transporter n=1 Tax=Antrihabitans cavernicola TaxID=2495913 RepID=A0A5A7S8P9_9NOCA|nr:ABC transporter permease [Spelaeibacter cavernicola]KAA0021579.1 antibiotic transporter [Spelaeibacter cavernicola]